MTGIFYKSLFPAVLVMLGLASCREPNTNPLQADAAGDGTPMSTEGNSSAGNATEKRSEGAAPLAATVCNIEYADGKVFGATPVPVATGALIRGWLGHDAGAPVAPRLVIADATGASTAEYPLQLDVERPDVVEAYPNRQGLERSGFKATLGPLAGTPPFHLYLLYDFGASTYICDNGRYVTRGP